MGIVGFNERRRHFRLYVYHTDAAREWACERQSYVGLLGMGLGAWRPWPDGAVCWRRP
jgi:hypothetical protein